MGRRDYEMEAAVQSVDARITESIVRALIVGSAGSNDGTLGGVFKQFFNRSRRKTGLRSKNVLVLTNDSVHVFTCKGGNDWPPRVDDEIGAWPVREVKVAAEAAEKWSAFSASHSGSVTNRFYDITLTVPTNEEPIVVSCPRSDSARTTIQALDDATGSRPSRITARRRKKQRREREAAQAAADSAQLDESADEPARRERR
jgi:hypothetical protein